jgi:hypothetical protein
MSSRYFYKNLPVTDKTFEQLISDKKNFYEVPKDWHIIVTDIRNSTGAYEKGKYFEMNIASASCIIIAMNIAKKERLEIPFIYGGDGASIVVPPDLLDETLEELSTLRRNVLKNFKISLRVGSVEVSEILQAGYHLVVAKYHVAQKYSQAVFLGPGLYEAEKIIKSDARHETKKPGLSKKLDLGGLQCRWDTIEPPKKRYEVVTLIVESVDHQDHGNVYKKILRRIDEIYGDFEERHPVSHNKIKHATDFKTLRLASYAKFGKLKPSYVIKHMFISRVSRFFSAIQAPLVLHDEYTEELMTATDTLKIDGTLKTIIAGNKKQREELVAYLENLEAKNEIFFGFHVSDSTTMTCYIHKKDEEYINFLDGAGGGYVQAARMLKPKKMNEYVSRLEQ